MIKNRFSFIYFLIFALFFPVLAHAQNDIVSDRPGIGDSPYVYGQGIFSAETGVQYLEDNTGQFELPILLLRYGIGNNLELRLNAGSLSFMDSFANNTITQQSFGMKYQILAEDGNFLSASAMIGLPFLNSNYSEWSTTLALQGHTNLNYSWGLDSNVGLVIPDLAGTFDPLSFNFNLTPSYSFQNPVNSAVYFGYAGSYNTIGEAHFAELGFTLLTAPNIQLDINSAKRLFDSGFFIGGGFAIAL